MGELRVEHGLTNVRFAPNPLSELALSTMIVRYPDRHPFHAAWYRATTAARERMGEERILCLVNPDKDIPDLLMRPSEHKATTFAAELGRVAALPAARWRRDLDYVWPDGLPTTLGATDTAVRDNACQILQDYWDGCMAAYWREFKTVLDADVAYRAQVLAAHGPLRALEEIGSGWLREGDDLVLKMRAPDYVMRWDAVASPLTMLPTLVKWNSNIPNREEADAVVSYRARGRGRLNAREVDTAPGLVGVFGRTRTELLLSLDEPASSTAIALFMGVTTSAANQHLRALAAAGLLTSQRFGRYVLYSRSGVADEMVAAAGADRI